MEIKWKNYSSRQKHKINKHIYNFFSFLKHFKIYFKVIHASQKSIINFQFLRLWDPRSQNIIINAKFFQYKSSWNYKLLILDEMDVYFQVVLIQNFVMRYSQSAVDEFESNEDHSFKNKVWYIFYTQIFFFFTQLILRIWMLGWIKRK